MKIIRLTLMALVLVLAGTSSAYAHGSVGFSINLGYPAYYAAPPVVYYSPPPVVYYDPAPVYYSYGYYGPRAYFNYYDAPRFRHHHDNGFHRGWDRRGWRD